MDLALAPASSKTSVSSQPRRSHSATMAALLGFEAESGGGLLVSGYSDVSDNPGRIGVAPGCRLSLGCTQLTRDCTTNDRLVYNSGLVCDAIFVTLCHMTYENS